MTNITLKQLRYVDALAQHQHFGRAAAVCSISQPALSMQIKELEADLGTPLFDRSGRNVQPTAFGEEVVQRARSILADVEELDDLARTARDSFVGRLRLGIIPTLAPYMLPGLIRALNRTYPALDLRVRETKTPALIDALGRGQIDAALVALPISEPALVEEVLFSEPFVLVRPQSDHDKPVPAPDVLAQMRLLLLEEGHCFRDQALSFCNMPTALPHKGMDGSSLSTLVQMVGAGLGVTLLPQMAVAIETRSAEVSVTPFQSPQPVRQIGMVWRRSSPLSAQLLQIAELTKGLQPSVQGSLA